MNIIHADSDIIVVDKPAFAIVHPAPGHEEGALTDSLLAMYPDMAGVGSEGRPGVVHRLDIETSGVMVFARTERAYLALRREFERHERVTKKYLAVLHGSMPSKTGIIDAPIGRKPWDPKRMAVDGTDAKRAVTRWEVLGRNGCVSLVEFTIETGRTHQIRVHAAHLGHPIAGDRLYGEAKLDARMRNRPQRCLLHAVELSFPHPSTRKRATFAAEPPADILYAG